MSAILLALFLSAPAEAKLVKTVLQKAHTVGEPLELPKATLACGETHRICQNGQKAAIVLPDCERVCPEDGRQGLACYKGLADEADETEIAWVEEPEVSGPAIYSAGAPGSESPATSPDCNVYEVVKRPILPAGPFRHPAYARDKVVPAR